MGIFIPSSRRYSYHFQYLAYLVINLLVVQAHFVEFYYFAYLISNGKRRIKAGHRILEYHRYLAASEQPHFLFAELQHIFSVQQNLALVHCADLTWQQLHYAERRSSFACAGFSY